MPVAYIISAYKLPDQLAQLVGRLWTPSDTFLLHIDAKVPLEPFVAALGGLLDKPNVSLMERITCEWAGFGLAEVMVNGVEEALRAPRPWTHVLHLTGQDYIAKEPAEIRAFFENAPTSSFMSWSSGVHEDFDPDAMTVAQYRGDNQRWYWDGNMHRIDHWHFRLRGRWIAFPNRKTPGFPLRRLPASLAAYHGSGYWALARDAAAYAVGELRGRPALLRYFRRVWAPDEFLMQMVLLNSPHAATVVNEDLRFMDWDNFHPALLGPDTAARIVGSGKLFARKIDETTTPGVMAAVDRELAGR